jgi:hypothetical protein
MPRSKRAEECEVRKFAIYEGVFFSFVQFSFSAVQPGSENYIAVFKGKSIRFYYQQHSAFHTVNEGAIEFCTSESGTTEGQECRKLVKDFTLAENIKVFL